MSKAWTNFWMAGTLLLTFGLPKPASAAVLQGASNGKPIGPGFNAAYIQESAKRDHFEIPELYELVNIAILLSGYDQNNHQKTFANSEYAQKVRQAFEPFKDHALIRSLSEKVRSINENYALRDNSYCYRFEGDRIVPTDVYNVVVPYRLDLIKTHLPLLEDFAKTSGFRTFFKANQSTYDRYKRTMERACRLNAQKKWLDAKYGPRKAGVRVVCSPLTGGNHRTHQVVQDGFNEMVLLVSAPTKPVGISREEEVGLMRITFTELDHNYVNPISNVLFRGLAKRPSSKSFATDQAQRDYFGSEAVFNEYMTWALFPLFLQETDSKERHAVGRENCVKIMNRRGFLRFEEFLAEAERLVAENPKIQGPALHKALLEWFCQAAE